MIKEIDKITYDKCNNFEYKIEKLSLDYVSLGESLYLQFVDEDLLFEDSILLKINMYSVSYKSIYKYTDDILLNLLCQIEYDLGTISLKFFIKPMSIDTYTKILLMLDTKEYSGESIELSSDINELDVDTEHVSVAVSGLYYYHTRYPYIYTDGKVRGYGGEKLDNPTVNVVYLNGLYLVSGLYISNRSRIHIKILEDTSRFFPKKFKLRSNKVFSHLLSHRKELISEFIRFYINNLKI